MNESTVLDPTTSTSVEGITYQSRAFRRFLAKALDYVLISAIVTPVFNIVLSPVLPGVLGMLAASVIGCVPLAIYDALCVAKFGKTLGKRVMNIEIHNATGSKLSTREAFDRIAKSLWRGTGLFVPLVNLVCQYFAYQSMNTAGQVSWDKDVSVKYGAMQFLN